MGNILTLTQSPQPKTVNLLPNGAGNFTQFEKVGDDANWKCVDDIIGACDEDATFVHSLLTNHNYQDAYNIENAPSDITDGMINYITVHVIAKSNLQSPAPNTIFDYGFIIGVSGYQPWGGSLTTSYTEYKHSWTSSPLHAGNWTWDDINNIQIGISALVYSTMSAEYELFLNDDGFDINEWDGKNIYNQWFTIYGTCGSCGGTIGDKKQYRTFEDSTLGSEYIISRVTLIAETCSDVGRESYPCPLICGCYACSAETPTAKLVIKTHGTEYFGSNFDLDYDAGNWATHVLGYSNNPNTGLAWTWTEVNDIVAGCYANDFSDTDFCGGNHVIKPNIKIRVNYLGEYTPDVRVSAEWLTVNYTPVDTVCDITMPSHLSRTVDENINAINFWDGTREVYFESQNLKTMVLEGYEYGSGADDRIICVRDMGRDGNVITIDGFSNNYFNTNYRIASYGWKLVSKLPLYYKWILELQELEEE
ncbi:hypothetical protein KAX02_01515 [candidate division WOR-3 bacterium]|nr:hypothetical protein [candidate division WOR-3 bacterium]